MTTVPPLHPYRDPSALAGGVRASDRRDPVLGLRSLLSDGILEGAPLTLLIAAGQNLKRFLAATGWGRRHAPCGSLVALSGEAGRLVVSYC